MAGNIREIRAVFSANAAGIRSNVRKIRNDLRDLGSTSSTSMNRTNNSLRDFGRSLEDVQQNLNNGFNGGSQGLQQLGNVLGQVQGEMVQTGRVGVQSQADLQNAINQSRQELSQMGNVGVDAMREMERAIDRAEQELQEIGRNDPFTPLERSAQDLQQAIQNSTAAGRAEFQQFNRVIEQVQNELRQTGTIGEQSQRDLRNAIAQSQADMSRLGLSGTDAMRDVERASGNLENSLQDLSQQTNDVTTQLNNVGNAGQQAGVTASRSIGGIRTATVAAVGAIAGLAGGFVGLVNISEDLQKSLNAIENKTNASAAEMEGMEEVLINIYDANYGESFQDIADSMSRVRQVTGLTGEDLEKATKHALLLRDSMGYDVNESMKTVSVMMKQFGIDAEEAFTLVAQGQKEGLDYSDDMLDSFWEYSVYFKQLGFDAEGMWDIFKAGADGGAFNLDKVGDSIKELGIRVKDESKTSIEAFEALGFNADDISNRFAKGGESAQKALAELFTALGKIEDPIKRNAIGVNLFGTQFEDLEHKTIMAMGNVRNQADMTADTLEKMDEVHFDTVGQAIQGMGRILVVELLLPIEKKIMPAISDMVNSFKDGLREWIEAFKVFMGFDATIPIILGLTAAIASYVAMLKVAAVAQVVFNTAIGIGTKLYHAHRAAMIAYTLAGGGLTGVIAALRAAMVSLNLTLLANPFVAVAAALIGIAVALVTAYKTSETFRNAVNNAWDSVKNATASAIAYIAPLLSSMWDGVLRGVDKLKELGTAVMPVLQKTASVIGGFFRKTGEKAGTFFVDGIRSSITAISGFFQGIGEWISGIIGEGLKNKAKDIAGGFIDQLKVGISSFGGILSLIAPTLTGIGLMLMGVTGPIGLLIGGVVSLVGTLYRLSKTNEDVRNALQSAWQGIQSVFSAAVGAIQPILDVFVDSFGQMAQELAPEFAKTIAVISESFAELKPAFAELSVTIGQALTELSGVFSELFSQLATTLVPLLSQMATQVFPLWLNVIQSVFPILLKIVQSVLPIVIELISSLVPLVLKIVTSILPALLQIVQSVFPVVLKVVQAVLPVVIDLIGALIPLILQIVQTILPALASVVQTIFPVVLKIVQMVLPIVATLLKTVISVVLELVKVVLPLILQVIQAVLPAALQIIQAVIPIIVTLLTTVMKVITGVLVPAIRMILQVVQAVFPVIMAVIKSALEIVTNTIRLFVALLKGDWKNAWDAVKNILSAAWTAIKAILKGAIDVIVAIVKAAWDVIKNVTSAVFNGIKSLLGTIWNGIKSSITTAVNAIKSLISAAWNAIKSTTTTIFNGIKSLLVTIWGNIKKSVSTAATDIKDGVIGAWNTLKTKTSDIFTGIKKTLSKLWDDIVDGAKKLPGRIGDGLKKMAGDVGKGVKEVGNKLAEGLEKGLNGAIDGLNWVLEKVNAPKIDPVKIKRYFSGTKGHGHSGGPAIVGDKRGGGDGPAELIGTPDGNMYLSPAKETLIPDLPRGSWVMPGKQTKDFLTGLPAYNSGVGDFVKGAASAVKNTVVSGVTKAKDLALDVWDYLDDVPSLMKKVYANYIPDMGLTGTMGDIAKGGVGKVKDSALEWIKEKVSSIFVGDGWAGEMEKDPRAVGPGSGFGGMMKYVEHWYNQVKDRFGPTRFMGAYNNRNVRGGNSKSMHAYGRAFDIGGSHETMSKIAEYLRKTASNIQYVIYNRKISGPGVGKNWRAYTGINPHTDHVHADFMAEAGAGAGPNIKGGASAWRPMILQAAARMNEAVTPAQVDGIIAQIHRESKGNQRIFQDPAVNDINMRNGNPARGLLQYIPSTFRNYMVKGHTDILNGMHQLLAFFNNTNWRKDLPYGRSGWGPTGARKYAEGGEINQPHLGLVGEAGPEIIIPYAQRFRKRALGLWQTAGEKLGAFKTAAAGKLQEATGTLGIPAYATGVGKVAGTVKAPATPAVKTPAVQTMSYIVKAGDTLTAIAKKFKTTVSDLVKLNKIKNPDLIKIGQKIIYGMQAGTANNSSKSTGTGSSKGSVKQEAPVVDRRPTYVKKVEYLAQQTSSAGAEAKIRKALSDQLIKLEKEEAAKIKAIKDKASKAKRDLTQKEKEAVWKIREDYGKKEVAAEKAAAAQITELSKVSAEERLKAIDDYVARAKEENRLSLLDEIATYRESMKYFKKNSVESLAAEKRLNEAKKRLHDQLMAMKDEYLAKVKEVNQRVIDEEKRLNKEYEDAVSDRARSLNSFAGLFDSVERPSEETKVDPETLIKNLEDQVWMLNNFDSNLDHLEARGLDKALIEELQAMGPQALDEIKALTAMTDTELNKFQSLWQEKSAVARSRAVQEMEGMRKDTLAEIQKLHTDAEVELQALNQTFQEQVAGLKTVVVEGFNPIGAQLVDIGKNAIKGLMDGMKSMNSPLGTVAAGLAQTIKDSIMKSLVIKSPSRWMKYMVGENIVQGVIDGITGMENNAVNTATTMADWFKPPINNGTFSGFRGSSNPFEGVMIQTTVEMDKEVVGRSVEPVVSDKQRGNYQNAKIVKGLW